MTRRILGAALALSTAATVVTVPQLPANAAPAAGNGKTEAVYFIHGIDWNRTSAGNAQVNCGTAWKAAKAGLKKHGWTGKLVTWGFYKKDTRCTRKANGDLNTRIQEVGRRLAWDIYNNYSKSGKSVDVVAHSMGGLVVRAAIEGVKRYGAKKEWPNHLYVEDVVTYSTPHTGTNWATTCLGLFRWKQCSDMRPNSGFLKWAGQNPQARGGTDWTLVGAGDDDYITGGSATGMKARHKTVYSSGQGLEHGSIKNKGPGNTGWKSRHSENGAAWKNRASGPGPIRLMYNALYYSKSW